MPSRMMSEVRFTVREGPDGGVYLFAENTPEGFPDVTLMLRADVTPQLAQEAANFINRHVERISISLTMDMN